jgi:hypothetical protein
MCHRWLSLRFRSEPSISGRSLKRMGAIETQSAARVDEAIEASRGLNRRSGSFHAMKPKRGSWKKSKPQAGGGPRTGRGSRHRSMGDYQTVRRNRSNGSLSRMPSPRCDAGRLVGTGDPSFIDTSDTGTRKSARCWRPFPLYRHLRTW